jgi:hypothetical protein
MQDARKTTRAYVLDEKRGLIGQIFIAANRKKCRYAKVLRELHVGGNHTRTAHPADRRRSKKRHLAL